MMSLPFRGQGMWVVTGDFGEEQRYDVIGASGRDVHKPRLTGGGPGDILYSRYLSI